MKATARPPRRSRILTVANGKGGVAKTTSALNIAFALADHHKQRVLLIDMDGQASTTVTLPRRLPPNAPKDSEAPKDTAFISDYFRGAAVLGSLVRPTRLDNVWLVPAAYQLQQMDSGGGARPQAELRFLADVRMLQTADEQGQDVPPFDWVVIDTPPA
jgi:chromosome partitioning protein